MKFKNIQVVCERHSSAEMSFASDEEGDGGSYAPSLQEGRKEK